MKYDVLYNFISPVTGYVLATTDYVLVGNGQGIAVPSPILIDIRLDLIELRTDFDLAASASYVIGFPNLQLPNAQVLSELKNPGGDDFGVMYDTAGIVSLIDPSGTWAPSNATYILQVPTGDPEVLLPNSQALVNLIPTIPYTYPLITKVVDIPTPGTVAIAVQDVDYLSVATANMLVDIATAAATAAAASAAQAAASAASAASSAAEAATSAAESAASAVESTAAAELSADAAAVATVAAIESVTAAGLAQGAATEATNAVMEVNNVLIEIEQLATEIQTSTDTTLVSSAEANQAASIALISSNEANLYLTQLQQTSINSLPVTGDLNMMGWDIINLQQSPTNDFDAVGFTFLWDLLHDRVQILWP